MLFDRLSYWLSPIVNSALWFFEFLQTHQMILALLSGVMLPFIFLLRKDEHQNAPFWKKLIFGFSMLCFLFGTIAPVPVWFLRRMYAGRDEVAIPVLSWSILLAFTAAGLITHILLRRLISPELDKAKRNLVKKTGMERDSRTDVRSVKELLPQALDYDPFEYIDLSKGIFIGLTKNGEPQYIPIKEWQSQHADIIGTTGAGKGVVTGILLYQSILADEGVFVLDPKNDEWAPHLYKKACEDAGKPFVLIDLNKQEYQMNLIDGITPDHLEELFVAGFSLAEKGEAADFYRIDDRKAARTAAQFVQTNPNATIRDIYNGAYVQGIGETIKAFHGKTEELAMLNSINAPGGFALKEIFDKGGCCYIIGSMRNSKIITAQRMILVRLYQLAELRDRVAGSIRPIAIFKDEVKYHLSKPALEGLGAARDKGVHILMAHQSIADLRDCPADLNGDAVVGAVVENCKFKLVYKLQDPDTAEWVARMSGTILVDDESRKVKTTVVLTEKIDDERMIRQAESYYIDANMLQNLPKFVSYIFSANTLAFPSLIAPMKVKKQPLEIFTVAPALAATIPDVKPVLDFDFDKEEAASAAKETIPPGIITSAGIELPVAEKPEKTLPVIDPHEEEWAFSSPPEPEGEKSSLLDFDF
ncbi:TraM recognition domain-containing protein [Salmonella enterica]|uniref:MFS transporter n=1 Tax=Salmonella enterica TaxID=28901 RepID=A0A402TR04_SALER|nr:type IV secretion system DNA-binding domain-containing protein [Salmonella enterica]EAA2780426.1 MFS transporter [Salmonella enterica subsp. enterica serovar Montevideo]EBQ0715305.1 MFS transporter [Salmonella enterica subsp. enterica]EBZ3099540.1 MFS transporter [Salmonella enterica subsp. enterica serovar Sandiego]ECQ4329935.1 TraM recognition domain-containing protein [Salmonella enterica subsp. enterica serovar Urbana]ECS6105469.1 MFS transporter [Salmonella enterica subsp. enterica ser